LGVPLQSAKVKVKCESLIPARDHCALLSSWEGLLGGVQLEYEQTKVEESLVYRRPDYEDGDGWDPKDGEIDTGGPGDGCVGWDGWPGEWPVTVGEIRGQRGESTAEQQVDFVTVS